MKTFIYILFFISIILHIYLLHSQDSKLKIHFSEGTANNCDYIDTNKINPYYFTNLYSMRHELKNKIVFDGKSYIFYSENLSLVNFEIEEIIYQNSQNLLQGCLIDYKIQKIEKVPSIIPGITIYIYFITFFILSFYSQLNTFLRKTTFFHRILRKSI